ncbi:MAG: hypothetical protein L3J20_06645 [Flavobacteriaceae bacterium]|nr:hypothetical protein [Flavobacteriaceae bacterium]
MKKKRVYIFIGIGILLMLLYLFRYKQDSTFINRIPNSATAIININTRQLEHHIVFDFLKHPITYLKSETTARDSIKKPKFSLTKGIEIPKNILFFTNNSTLKKAWYSSVFEMSNPEELSRYLLTKNFKKNNTIYSKDNFVFALKDKQLIIAITYDKKSNITEAIQTIFNEKDFLNDGSPLLKPILENASDICLTTTNHDFFEANFKDGMFKIQGKANPNFDLFISTMQPEFTQNSLAFITGKINKTHVLFKNSLQIINQSKFNKITHLSLDSITDQWSGTFSFNLKSIKSKTDTIITYNYDDDFNKVEIKSTQKLIIPELEFELKSEKDSILYNYFLQENAIQVIENETLFVAFPLYKLYAHPTKRSVIISDKKGVASIPVKESVFKLKGYFNIEEYIQNQLDFISLPSENEHIKLLKETSFQLSNKNKLSVKVNLKNANRNFLGQLIKP